MNRASLRHSSPNPPRSRRFRAVLHDHVRHSRLPCSAGASTACPWWRRCNPRRRSESAGSAAAGRGPARPRRRDEGADLESALTGVAISRLDPCTTAAPACRCDCQRRRNSRSQASLIFPESGVAGQCEMPPVPITAIRSRHAVRGAAQGLAERPGAVQRRQRRTLAVDVHRDDGQIVLGASGSSSGTMMP